MVDIERFFDNLVETLAKIYTPHSYVVFAVKGAAEVLKGIKAKSPEVYQSIESILKIRMEDNEDG